ncbi:riboflavin kinase, partial [Candidatus Uhrbacteria bacterium]|nr:riboflavin kinase [Candidatus Uhrbacteria bacterium]
MKKYLFEVCGTVQKNKGRGRALGFPTANIPCSKKEEDGIYIAHAKYGEEMVLPALLFIGKALTFGDDNRLCEIYILDFDQNIEGEVLTVQ